MSSPPTGPTWAASGDCPGAAATGGIGQWPIALHCVPGASIRFSFRPPARPAGPIVFANQAARSRLALRDGLQIDFGGDGIGTARCGT
jgi:hypothetical protein